jgi:hypothetical protein
MFSAWQCDAWAIQRKAIKPISAMFSNRRRISEIDNRMTKYVQSFSAELVAGDAPEFVTASGKALVF